METQRTPRVVVIGAGPVGLTAALGLVREGVPTLILEAAPALSDLPRASTFHPPTLEMLDELGIARKLLREGYRVDRIQYRERSSGIVAEFDFSLLKDTTPFPFRLQCPQNRLCELLAEELGALDLAGIRFGSKVERIEQDDERVSIFLEGGEEIEADYVVAADGASSVVRKQLGIEFEGTTYETRNLQLMTTFDFASVFPDLAMVNYIFDPEEWCVIMRTPPGVWRVLFPLEQGESEEEALDDEVLQARLRRLASVDEEIDVAYKAVYTVHQRVARTFRSGRALLVGDAAHVNSPIGGMGMNSGIHDAVTLRRPLLAALRGGDAGLDEWAAERRRVAIEYVRGDTDRNTRALKDKDPASREARNTELSAKAADPDRAREHLLRTSMLVSARGEPVS